MSDRWVLCFILFFGLGSLMGQDLFEIGALYGQHKLWTTKVDELPSENFDNSFSPSSMTGLYLGYEKELKGKGLRLRVHRISSVLDYDLFHSYYRKGSGASGSYYNSQRHEIVDLSFQLGFQLPLFSAEKSEVSIYLGPELHTYRVKETVGSFGDHRFDGFSQDSTGQWLSGPYYQNDSVFSGPSQQSLSDLIGGLFTQVQLKLELSAKVNFNIGVEAAIGLGDIISEPGQGSASPIGYRCTVGLNYVLAGRKEEDTTR